MFDFLSFFSIYLQKNKIPLQSDENQVLTMPHLDIPCIIHTAEQHRNHKTQPILK